MNLICGDCLEPHNIGPVDLVFADLPYGCSRKAWDVPIDLGAFWDILDGIVRDHTPIVFTATQPFSSVLVNSRPKWFRYEWIWHKSKPQGHYNAKIQPLRDHEHVLVFGKETPHYYPQKTEGHPPVNSYTKHTGVLAGIYGGGKVVSGGGNTDRYPRTVQQFGSIRNDKGARLHASEKPVDLMEYLVKTYTLPNQVVLDPVMGSGSTGVACANLGRAFVGIEKDPDIFESARLRLIGDRNG